ncbi:MAG: TIGR03960 family B12-binding radical SAM protein [Proteobacteria bacterium]|nr:TIGR03960 family B12-binding radical SAM protein [Pseudomonadota bacterium]
MGNLMIQDILPFCEKPSRYLGCETNIIKKKSGSVKLNISLVFPDLYEIGTSHFGIQILYSILNSHNDIAAERVFYPGADIEDILRAGNIPLFSLESKRPLQSFDIVGFSLLYELNYTNIISILDLSHIPFLASERDNTYPFIIAGGPCTFNPEPVADIFDAMVIGDGENIILEMSEKWISWKQAKTNSKSTLLEMWSELPGVYIPSFFKPVYNGDCNNNPLDGFTDIVPIYSHYTKVKKAVLPDIDKNSFPESPIVPFGKPVHDRLRIEIARGCSRGCRFCQAGMIYRPVRERSVDTILTITENAIKNTGYNDISLLSLSTGDYSDLAGLISQLMGGGHGNNSCFNHTAISLPSIRADVLTPELMSLIKRVRKTGFTIAPEAGTDRLRKVINKGLTEKEIIDTVQNAFNLGWKVIKLYFMVGLPTETEEDLTGIVDLVKKLKSLKGSKGRKPTLNVSVTTFIPKAHTPFQWMAQIGFEESMAKIFRLKKILEIPGVQFKWQDPKVSLLEGIWARGDRRLTPVLISAYKKGCKLDGWRDYFNFDLWKEAFQEENVDITRVNFKYNDFDNSLPWDHIDSGVKKSFLVNEWHHALKSEFTEDCRNGSCSGCGVCDFKEIKPVLFNKINIQSFVNATDPLQLSTSNSQQTGFKYFISFSKQGMAKYLSHLELVNIIMRAIKRTDIPVQFSNGFHPKPKISFDDPLPVGIETLEDFFYFELTEYINPETIEKKLNSDLPEGILINSCRQKVHQSKHIQTSPVRYLLHSSNCIFDETCLNIFFLQEKCILIKTNKKGQKKEIDLKKLVLKIELLDSYNLLMLLIFESGLSVRPSEIIKTVFSFSDNEIKPIRILKVPVKKKAEMNLA